MRWTMIGGDIRLSRVNRTVEEDPMEEMFFGNLRLRWTDFDCITAAELKSDGDKHCVKKRWIGFVFGGRVRGPELKQMSEFVCDRVT